MSNFEFVFSLLVILLGLALAEVLGGLARVLKRRPRIRVGWATALIATWTTTETVLFWRVVWRARNTLPDKSAVLLIQLPLGISLTEPVQLKVDNGTVERYPVQTCTNVGCIVNVPLKDPLMAAMRAGTLLKIAIQDTNKRTINIDVPLLGFGLAFDKAK